MIRVPKDFDIGREGTIPFCAHANWFVHDLKFSVRYSTVSLEIPEIMTEVKCSFPFSFSTSFCRKEFDLDR